jgi:C-terminal processing protease CtpA/Prc
MKPLLLAFLLAILVGPSTLICAQAPDNNTRANLEPALGFEAPLVGTMPAHWNAFPGDSVSADDKVVHSGRYSARIESDAKTPNSFATVKNSLPIDFSGSTVELRGYLRTEAVSGFAGFWLREDGDTPNLEFDNMQARQIKGDTAWTEYSIVLPLHPNARMLYFGALVFGTGRAWADDLQLLVDGKPIWDAPKAHRAKTVLESDHQFDGGSKVVVSELSDTQIENLVTLGKVWGFLKYHHPVVTSGQKHWDYELFRVLPTILAAQDRASANAAILKWINSLGPVQPCQPCVKLDAARLHLRPQIGWLSDERMLGADLSRTLRSIYENRSSKGQFYVSLKPEVENPSFDLELAYADLKLPDFGFQLLAVYRFWNAVEYWSPNRNIIGEDWDAVLAQSIPRVALAKDEGTFKRQLLALIAKFHDGHANLWAALDARPPYGNCKLPITVRYVEDRLVVSALTAEDAKGFKVGDVLTELDGTPVTQLIKEWMPYYTGSNDAAIMRDIAGEFPRGNCGEVKVRVQRSGQDLLLSMSRASQPAAAFVYRTHDLPGPTFRLLSKDVAYLKLSTVKAAEAVHYIEQASGTRGLIIDIRNYPSEFMVFALGSHLVEQETPFARFTVAELENPGAFHWGIIESLKPSQPHYSGKIVILVDETSMSQAEYTSMAFRAAPGATVVGSTTAGADGNVSKLMLPGNLFTMISGIGVFYPDKKPTQRIGIVPDIQAKPTIAGIAAGRDEVLEQAIRQILGNASSAAEIEKLAKPQ